MNFASDNAWGAHPAVLKALSDCNEGAVGSYGADPVTARAEEWEKITGACDTRMASSMVSSETWLRSTIMPRRFISRTTASPKAFSPPHFGASVALSAQLVVLEWVRVM